MESYAVCMDTMNQEVARRIAATIEDKKRSDKTVSNKSVAERAGIPVSSFHRRLNLPGPFTIPELARLADVLHVHPNRFLPEVFADLKETA